MIAGSSRAAATTSCGVGWVAVITSMTSACAAALITTPLQARCLSNRGVLGARSHRFVVRQGRRKTKLAKLCKQENGTTVTFQGLPALARNDRFIRDRHWAFHSTSYSPRKRYEGDFSRPTLAWQGARRWRRSGRLPARGMSGRITSEGDPSVCSFAANPFPSCGSQRPQSDRCGSLTRQMRWGRGQKATRKVSRAGLT